MSNPGDLFFTRTCMDRGRVQATVNDALKGSDDGELYLEYRQSESFAFDDGRLKAATFDTTQGFGLRAVAGEADGRAVRQISGGARLSVFFKVGGRCDHHFSHGADADGRERCVGEPRRAPPTIQPLFH